MYYWLLIIELVLGSCARVILPKILGLVLLEWHKMFNGCFFFNSDPVIKCSMDGLLAQM